MQDKLTPRQVRAWSLCALSVPAAMALPGCGWLWVLGGSILACALAACQQAMQRQSGLCMRQAFACAFGAVGGQIMAAAELLWLLFAASGAAAAGQIAFEDDLGPFLPAIPLLLAALAGQKGRLAAGRVCAVLALCLAGLYTVIAAASLRHVQVDWSRPQGVPADAALPEEPLALSWTVQRRAEERLAQTPEGICALSPLGLSVQLARDEAPDAAGEVMASLQVVYRDGTVVHSFGPNSASISTAGEDCSAQILVLPQRGTLFCSDMVKRVDVCGMSFVFE